MRILGIDWGTSSIKAVEMDSAFGRYDIHDYHENPIDPNIPAEQTVAELINSLPKAPDKIVVSLGSAYCTFRNLQLPTRDKKAIQASVGFELEDELPFPSEDSVLDYVTVSQSKQGSNTHVAATLKKHLITTINMWNKAEVDPDVITTEAWAYRTLMNRVLGATDQSSPVLLVQIGHERTTFYLHWYGAPALIREMQWGGKDLTQAISTKLGIYPEQAETTKLDHGFVTGPANPAIAGGEARTEKSDLSRCLERALADTLMVELRQTGLASKSITRHSISMIYLAGGTSLLPGLSQWIEERISIPTRPLQALSTITPSGVTYSDQTDARFLLAASLTLSVVGPDKSSCINFRKREFSREGKSTDINFEALRKPLYALATVSISLFVSLVVQSNVYESRLKTTDKLLEKSVKSFFGQLSSSALKTYMKNTTALRASINKELTKQRELARLFGPNSRSPIDFLNSLSNSIPKDLVVDMTNFDVGTPASDPFTATDPSTSLSLIVANPQVAERLSGVLGNRISNLQRGKMDEVASSDGASKKWKIVFTGKPSEDSYGK